MNIITIFILIAFTAITKADTTIYVDSNSQYLAPKCGFVVDQACQTIHDAVYTFGNTTSDSSIALDIKMLGGTYYNFTFLASKYPPLDITNYNINISPFVTGNNSKPVIISGQYFRNYFLTSVSQYNIANATSLQINNISFTQFTYSIMYYLPTYRYNGNSFLFNNIQVYGCSALNPLFYFAQPSYVYSNYVYPNVSVSNSVFSNNKVNTMSVFSKTSNGLWFLYKINLVMENNVFKLNAIPSISCSYSIAVFNFSTFDSNSYGSSIYTTYTKVSILNSLFITNNQKYYGSNGGAYSSDSDLYVVIQNSTFNGNYANYGGAIYLDSSRSTITDSHFISNEATQIGGALYFWMGSSSVSNTFFENNVANSGMTANMYYSSVTFTNSSSYFVSPYPTSSSGSIISLNTNSNFMAFNFSVSDYVYTPTNGGQDYINVISCSESTFSLDQDSYIGTYNQNDKKASCYNCDFYTSDFSRYDIQGCQSHIGPNSKKTLTTEGKVLLAFLIISIFIFLAALCCVIAAGKKARQFHSDYNEIHDQHRFIPLISK
ncbi:hypothetical protein CYY_008715 [Polysphondylium violaceum]|uniref:Right handed beta helix domain-containing protein n=1 Tax=Polysphondylium violaceum TaxID=133409 RepID=A0A8J4PN00_9MYCE|nr:hypothetical protein CYY_008715 [Polysphondylium violaceum]